MTTPETKPIISLTTDFGRSDGYVGAMTGVILGICPQAAVTHLSHLIPPQDIQTAAFVLYQSFSYYPVHAVHCVVVDPGVGSARRAVAVRTSHGTFVGPDNGVFSLVLESTTVLAAVSLENPDYQLPQVSRTFHGRDIFAPAAAHIASGVPLERLGPPVPDLVREPLLAPPGPGRSRVIHIDHFGNVVLGLTVADVTNPNTLQITAGQTTLTGLSQTFAEVEPGQPLLYVGSTQGHIELAIRNGNAAKALDIHLNDVVQVRL